MGQLIPITSVAERAKRRTKIDRYGDLDHAVKLFEPTKAEHELLKKEIQGWHSESDAASPVTDTGADYRVQLSARRNERTIVNKKKAFLALKAALGSLDGVIAVLDLPLGVLDKHVPESQLEGVIHEERSGYRTIEAVPLNPPVSNLKKAA